MWSLRDGKQKGGVPQLLQCTVPREFPGHSTGRGQRTEPGRLHELRRQNWTSRETVAAEIHKSASERKERPRELWGCADCSLNVVRWVLTSSCVCRNSLRLGKEPSERMSGHSASCWRRAENVSVCPSQAAKPHDLWNPG